MVLLFYHFLMCTTSTIFYNSILMNTRRSSQLEFPDRHDISHFFKETVRCGPEKVSHFRIIIKSYWKAVISARFFHQLWV